MYLIKIKYCEDTRPGQQFEAAWWQHADLCKLIGAEVVTLHTVLLGIGGACYTEHTKKQSKQLDHHHQCAIKVARKLHAHSKKYAHKLVTARRTIEDRNASYSQLLEPGAFNNPPDPH
eukprot:1137707-Pelagomonas_calceolata.AAC.3